MNRVRARLRNDMPEVSGYFQSGGLVDAVLNLGLAAPIDVQVSGMDLDKTYRTALDLASKLRQVHGVSDLLIPLDMDYPALRLDVDRQRAGTSLATILGLIPMAMKLGTGSEAYAPLARAIIGGLLVSVVVTVYLVPAAYVIVHRKSEARLEEVHS